MKSRQTDRKKELIKGLFISFTLIITPFLFYFYTFSPNESTHWDTFLGTIQSGGFRSVQVYLHALFTKITFIIITGTWFLTTKHWWKYAILVPFTMFLFQLSGIINYKMQFIDEYDFWYSLPFIIPIVAFIILISYILSKKDNSEKTLDEDAQDFVKNMLSDKL